MHSQSHKNTEKFKSFGRQGNSKSENPNNFRMKNIHNLSVNENPEFITSLTEKYNGI